MLCERNLVSSMMSALEADLLYTSKIGLSIFMVLVSHFRTFAFFAHLWLTAATCLLNTTFPWHITIQGSYMPTKPCVQLGFIQEPYRISKIGESASRVLWSVATVLFSFGEMVWTLCLVLSLPQLPHCKWCKSQQTHSIHHIFNTYATCSSFTFFQANSKGSLRMFSIFSAHNGLACRKSEAALSLSRFLRLTHSSRAGSPVSRSS